MRATTLAFAIAAAAVLPASAQAPVAADAGSPVLERMRSAAAEGDLDLARRLAVRIVRDEHSDAADVEALWLMAQIDNSEGHGLRAAAALDQAAAKAAVYGDPVAQVQALVESATLYASHRRFAEAAERVAQVRPLMASPHLSAELRAEAAARLHL